MEFPKDILYAVSPSSLDSQLAEAIEYLRNQIDELLPELDSRRRSSSSSPAKHNALVALERRFEILAAYAGMAAFERMYRTQFAHRVST